MDKISFDNIISQLKSELNSDCAIANKYGIILGSLINEFGKDQVITQKLLELISKRHELAEELNLNEISSFALETQKFNYLFTFSKELILISKLAKNVDLTKFMPSISTYLKKLSESYKESEIKEFSKFDFSKELTSITDTLQKEEMEESKYSVIKDLIKYIAKT